MKKFSVAASRKNIIFLIILIASIGLVRAQSSLDSLLDLFQNQNELRVPVERAELNAKIGIQYRIGAEYVKSAHHLKEALEYYRSTEDSTMLAIIFNDLGETYRNADEFDLAVDNYLSAVDINEKTGAWDLLAINYTNLGKLYQRQRDYDNVKLYIDKTTELLQRSVNPEARASNYNNIGRVFNSSRQFDSAIFYHKIATEIFDSLELYHEKGRAMHNIANSTREKGLYDEAISICEEILSIPEIKENPKSYVFTILLLADIYNNSGNPQRGIEYGLKGLETAVSKGLLDRKRVALLYLSQSYELLADFQQAFDYHQKYTALQDSIFDANRYREMANMEAKYENERKERIIEVQNANLQLQSSRASWLLAITVLLIVLGLVILVAFWNKSRVNKILVRQKNEIERQNAEREILLKEIHHRVKNNLQIISSILSIQSRKLDNEEAKKAVLDGQNRIKSMSLIHQRLYDNDNLAVVDMKEYVEELSKHLFAAYRTGGEVSRTLDVRDIKLDIDTAIPLGLIMNELISNALKYAFTNGNGGSLNISLGCDQDNCKLTVQDSGVGLPENINFESSMGMQLIHTLVDQIDGSLNIRREDGTCFEILFQNAVSD